MVHLHILSRCDPSTRWPFRKRTPQGQLRGPRTYSIEMQCSKRRRIRLCSKAKGSFCSCVAWGWRIYINSGKWKWPVDPSTRWPFRKRTPQGQMGGQPTYTHQVWQRSVKGPRGNREHTNKRCLHYSMMIYTVVLKLVCACLYPIRPTLLCIVENKVDRHYKQCLPHQRALFCCLYNVPFSIPQLTISFIALSIGSACRYTNFWSKYLFVLFSVLFHMDCILITGR